MYDRNEEEDMATYLIINEHRPEECQAMEEDMDKLSDRVKGKDFHCTCPHGKHGYYLFLDGESSEDVIGALPPSFLLGTTRADQLETMKLPE
jgi:hypothetical protein